MHKFDIFLSHNGADKEWTEKLAYDIENNTNGKSLHVFFDKWDIEVGADIPREIEYGLQNSRFIGLVLSPQALLSEWVSMERSTAIIKDPSSKNRTIIPICRRPCDIPLALKRIKHLDFTDDKKHEQSLGQLLSILRGVPAKRGADKTIETIHLQEDQHLFEELLYAFARPAFRTPCIDELFICEMMEAIDDTQTALNTGKLFSRNHNLLRETGAIADFRTERFRRAFLNVSHMLTELKTLLLNFQRFYHLTYPNFDSTENFFDMFFYLSRNEKKSEIEMRKAKKALLEKMDEIDKLRNRVITCLNSINNNPNRELPLIQISSSLKSL